MADVSANLAARTREVRLRRLGLRGGFYLFALCGALSAPPVTAASKPAPVRIDAIRAYLLYERTGRLSSNVAPPAKFGFWNTPIGEGDAKEPANDVLIAVVLSGHRDRIAPGPLHVTVSRQADGKVLAERRFGQLLFSRSTKLVEAVFVPNVTCTPIEVVAQIAGRRKTAKLDFRCGE